MTVLPELSVPLLLISSIILSYGLFRATRTPVPHPPGPRPKPIIGNALDLPLRKSWIKYMEWSKQFKSSVIYLTAMNTHIVVLNTMEDIVELLERRSTNYSNRPKMKLVNLLGFDVVTGLLPYGNTLKQHRRVMDEALRKDVMPSYHPIFVEKVHLLLGQLLRDPKAFREHCLTLGASTTMALAFGYSITPGLKDPFTEPAEFAVNTAADLSFPGRTLLSVFGFLGHIPPWVPGASTQMLCARVKEAVMRTRQGPYQYVKQKMAAGTSKDCALVRLLERDSGEFGSYEGEELLQDIMATFYFGGVETMKTMAANFILAMALHPDVQRRAQEEIDEVIGSHKLPSFDDRSSLPYIEALYREVHRWRPVLPCSIPHVTADDDIYKGYYIPRGTLVLPNIWAVTRNEDKYPDPESFKPERFFNVDEMLSDDTVTYTFGFGRRICPGRHMADRVVWLAIVSILATFNISKARDEGGHEIDIDATAFTDGMTSQPLPFKCSIVPRSPRAESLVRNVAEVASQNLTKEE